LLEDSGIGSEDLMKVVGEEEPQKKFQSI
jgi:hypothetical protein